MTDVVEGDGDALFMVAIGASAGGLEAIRELVRNLPTDAHAAYLILQHMAPDHRSMLTKLIQRETSLAVTELVTGSRPVPGTIHVAPPNCDVTLTEGRLILDVPGRSGQPKPSVDRFFESAAPHFADRMVGIVLSGTGSDGAHGIKSIREAGGITIAQEPTTAKYDGMPLSAIETGDVDLVFPPIQIGTHLARIIAMPRDLEQFSQQHSGATPLTEILRIVLARTRVDFRDYKTTTIQRRLERRMIALGLPEIEAYTDFCRSNPHEVDRLFKDLLISVTRFFRDPKEFFSLRPLIQDLVDENSDRILRLWVVGCATGEEAYSLAILVAEALGGPEKISRTRIQIFATDIDEAALQVARRGRYPRAAVRDIPDALVDRYFAVGPEHIDVRPALKDVILFSEHNLCDDPPFMHVDMVCCRNLLIYFNAQLQRRVLTRLHYALAEHGLLFLGTAETTTVSEDLFKVVSREAHLYRRRYNTSSHRVPTRRARSGIANGTGRDQRADHTDLDRKMFDALAASVASEALLFSEDGRIVRVYGDISRYVAINDRSQLQFGASILLPPLAQEVRSLNMVAIRRGERRRGIQHVIWEGEDPVQLESFPLSSDTLDEKFALVAINRVPDDRVRISARLATEDSQTAQHVQMLEFELMSLREELQQTIEELETSNEELQAANEELQSSNEELQSTNEELETSNEELQSTNEELVTVNEELQVSSHELTMLADESAAVIASAPSPLLVVDLALQIDKANDAAVELFSLKRPIDRPHLSQIAHPTGFPNIAEICNETLRFGRIVSRHILSNGRHFQLRCAPYSNQDRQIRGATMIFVETQFPPVAPTGDGAKMISDMVFFAHRRGDGSILNIGYENARALFEHEPAELTGRNFGEFLDPASAERVRVADDAFLASDRSINVSQYRVRFRTQAEDHIVLTYRFRLYDERFGEDTILAVGWTLAEEIAPLLEA